MNFLNSPVSRYIIYRGKHLSNSGFLKRLPNFHISLQSLDPQYTYRKKIINLTEIILARSAFLMLFQSDDCMIWLTEATSWNLLWQDLVNWIMSMYISVNDTLLIYLYNSVKSPCEKWHVPKTSYENFRLLIRKQCS